MSIQKLYIDREVADFPQVSAIAERLGLELKLVRPSDILDPYVGGTERNIAAIFRESTPKLGTFTGKAWTSRRNWGTGRASPKVWEPSPTWSNVRAIRLRLMTGTT